MGVSDSNLEATQDTEICSVKSISAHPEEIGKYFINDQVMKAEIVWYLCTITMHSSFRSNSDLPEIFRIMFSDSSIAKRLHLKDR